MAKPWTSSSGCGRPASNGHNRKLPVFFKSNANGPALLGKLHAPARALLCHYVSFCCCLQPDRVLVPRWMNEQSAAGGTRACKLKCRWQPRRRGPVTEWIRARSYVWSMAPTFRRSTRDTVWSSDLSPVSSHIVGSTLCCGRKEIRGPAEDGALHGLMQVKSGFGA